jgi:uncharacterized protein YeaO (DUF488 family)
VTTLFTSSYRAYRPDMGQAVVTSLGLPKWMPEAQTFPRCWLLTPTGKMFHAVRESKDTEAFAREYEQRLEAFGIPRIGRTLERIARQYDAESLVLLCHELDAERCHRLQFAQWLLARSGELVAELVEVVPQQLTLPTM